jgi:DNA-binding XRE family transcriptional regulator
VAVETERDPQTVGELIRFWRTQRRLTQMELALDANLSTKHLSFVETGRSRPSRQLLVHLTCRSPSVTACFSPAASLRPT